jgi:ABC-2 type transport system ATP-binding protein
MNIIELKNVTKRYSNHLALDDVSIEIPKQAVFGLLGPNGAGKTSLIRMITRITAPDSGSILFNGNPLTKGDMYKMGYLPEERGLYKKMQVGEQAMYLARLKGLSRAEATKRLKYWFEKFDIQPWWNKKVEELSKGMAQKVQFITTILHEPSFIILDEPFSGFDPINAELIKNELLELQQKGATIVLSTHRMESVEELCSHIALINNAKAILKGSVREIKSRFSTRTFELIFTGSFNLNVPEFAGRIVLKSMTEDIDGRSHAIVKLAEGMTTNDLLLASITRCNIHGLKEIVPGMNDIFIQQVGASAIS